MKVTVMRIQNENHKSLHNNVPFDYQILHNSNVSHIRSRNRWMHKLMHQVKDTGVNKHENNECETSFERP